MAGHYFEFVNWPDDVALRHRALSKLDEEQREQIHELEEAGDFVWGDPQSWLDQQETEGHKPGGGATR